MSESIFKLVKGFSPKELNASKAPETVGELIALLKKVPSDLPVCTGCEDEGVKLVWFNVGRENEEHLEFVENDGLYDDEEEEEEED